MKNAVVPFPSIFRALATSAHQSAEAADTILAGGKSWTTETHQQWAEGFAVKGGKLVAEAAEKESF